MMSLAPVTIEGQVDAWSLGSTGTMLMWVACAVSQGHGNILA